MANEMWTEHFVIWRKLNDTASNLYIFTYRINKSYRNLTVQLLFGSYRKEPFFWFFDFAFHLFSSFGECFLECICFVLNKHTQKESCFFCRYTRFHDLHCVSIMCCRSLLSYFKIFSDFVHRLAIMVYILYIYTVFFCCMDYFGNGASQVRSSHLI